MLSKVINELNYLEIINKDFYIILTNNILSVFGWKNNFISWESSNHLISSIWGYFSY